MTNDTKPHSASERNRKWSVLSAAVLFAALMLWCQPLAAQAARPIPVPSATTASAVRPAVAPQDQIAVDVGILSAAISYARRMGDSRWSAGVGLWGAWEPPNTFAYELWEPIGIVGFARYRRTDWLQADLGLTAARYLWADDCSDCTGTLVGLRSAVFFGRGMFFVGPEILFGRTDSNRHGSDFGLLAGAHVRVLVGFGR